jgi:hypothetical protein
MGNIGKIIVNNFEIVNGNVEIINNNLLDEMTGIGNKLRNMIEKL